MTAAELQDLDIDTEAERVLLWREEELERAGYDRDTARQLAEAPGVDRCTLPGPTAALSAASAGLAREPCGTAVAASPYLVCSWSSARSLASAR